MVITNSIFVLFLILIPFASSENYKYEIKFLDVPLDHFSYVNNTTFKLRYLINNTFAKDDTGPILFYTGNEGDIELFAQNTGFMWEIAPQLNAIVVFAEHRFYGKTQPFGNHSYDSPQHLGYLTSEQALADFAFLLNSLNPVPKNSREKPRPVIAFGGSYGGMLSAWMRMKYPHLVEGSISSSAPIRQFKGLTPCNVFNKILTSVFKTAYHPTCIENIKRVWDLLKKLAGNGDGLKTLNEKFRFCKNLTKVEDLKEFTDYLTDVYGNLAMANYPYPANFLAPLPAYPVREFCGRLDRINFTDIELLNHFESALSIYSNYTGKIKCLDIQSAYDSNMGDKGWEFQACTEMVMPMCADESDMFPVEKWDFKKYSDDCFKKFSVRPNEDTAIINYGGRSLDAASNIVFSNGLLDPWSGGGVLRNSNPKIKIVLITEGAHHMDLRAAHEKDPGSVIGARKVHIKSIQEWISNYHKRSIFK
uniref:Lysosomal Pro-X carboxypeptidase n=1 Tax=Corethrella appendiculata TaxID=1370023 RepID=U5ET05_9DIPT